MRRGATANITSDEGVLSRGQASFRRKLCLLSFQQTAAGGNRSAIGRRQGLVPRRGHAAGFSVRTISFPTTSAIRLAKIQTNSARALGTNAMPGHIWDNFSSQTYKELPMPDEVDFYNPFDETQPIKFQPKAKHTGPGYYRVASLVSLWSSAPFLHNNTLGKFTGDPSIAGRLERLQRRYREAPLAGEASREGFHLAHSERMQPASTKGIRPKTASSAWPIATVI